MGLAAVQLHVKQLLDGLVAPQAVGPLQAHVAPPVPGSVTVPQAYVWGARMREERQSVPRGAGFRRARWDVYIWLYDVEASDDAQADTRFPALIDAVLNVLRTAPMPVPLTDPVTGAVTQLVAIGEEFELDVGTPRATADQRLVWQNALVQAPCIEIAQG